MITLHQFWTLAICLIGAVQCLFLSSYFALLKHGNVRAHRLLALLMLLVGLRLSKSAYYIFEGDRMPLWLLNTGFAAHLAVAPLLFLYLRSVVHQKIFTWKQILHFIPAIIIIICSPFLQVETFWYRGGYSVLLIYSIIYWALAVQLLSSSFKNKEINIKWLMPLFFGVSVFLLAYFSNYMLRLIPYELAPMLYSIAIFPVSFAAWRNYELSSTAVLNKVTRKYQNLELSVNEIERQKSLILNYLQEAKPFLNPEFSLQELSQKTQIPTHQLSHVLNQHLHTNFTSLINQYRIQRASEMLQDPALQHFTIAAIAYEAGFNSLSVFNQTFKKVKGITPSAYRKNHQKSK